MAAAVGRREWRDSTPESIEADLAALWRDVARQGAVARAVMSNLVVFRLSEPSAAGVPAGTSSGESGDAAADLLDEIIARHPSRVVVIEHAPGGHDACGPVGASVGVSLFGPPSARYGVESVVLRSACADASLPSIVRRFVRGDLPTSIWWTGDLSRVPPPQALITMGRQLVYDSRQWRSLREGVAAVAALAADRTTDLADLNWRRLGSLRQALVHAASSVNATAVTADQVHISHRSGEGALAWLLAGWLAAKLGWPTSAWPWLAQADGDDEILSLTIGAERPLLEARLNDHRVHLAVSGRPAFTLTAMRETQADAIAAELRTLACETDLHDALKGLSQHLGSVRAE